MTKLKNPSEQWQKHAGPVCFYREQPDRLYLRSTRSSPAKAMSNCNCSGSDASSQNEEDGEMGLSAIRLQGMRLCYCLPRELRRIIIIHMVCRMGPDRTG